MEVPILGTFPLREQLSRALHVSFGGQKSSKCFMFICGQNRYMLIHLLPSFFPSTGILILLWIFS